MGQRWSSSERGPEADFPAVKAALSIKKKKGGGGSGRGRFDKGGPLEEGNYNNIAKKEDTRGRTMAAQ